MKSPKSSRRSPTGTRSSSRPSASKWQRSKPDALNAPDAEKQRVAQEIADRLPELERIARDMGFEKVEALLQFARAELDAAIHSDQPKKPDAAGRK